MSWTTPISSLIPQNFHELFQNQFSALIIPNFLTPEECQRAATEIQALGLGKPDYAFDPDNVPPSRKLFDSHYLYEQKTPDEYFPKAVAATEIYHAYCKKLGFNPALRVRDYLSTQLEKPVNIAEQEGKRYTYAMVRELSTSALLHLDFAKFIPSYWSISNTVAECAWNIYLTDPGVGGECVVYNRPGEPEDDAYLIPDSYAHDRKLVEGCEYAEIPVQTGQLVIFNCRNYHEVRSSENLRLTIGGHIGMDPHQEFSMWI